MVINGLTLPQTLKSKSKEKLTSWPVVLCVCVCVCARASACMLIFTENSCDPEVKTQGVKS